MIIPVKCFTCGSLVSDKWMPFISETTERKNLSKENVWVKRPGTGEILAKDFQKVLEYKAKMKISKNTQIKWNMIEK